MDLTSHGCSLTMVLITAIIVPSVSVAQASESPVVVDFSEIAISLGAYYKATECAVIHAETVVRRWPAGQHATASGSQEVLLFQKTLSLRRDASRFEVSTHQFGPAVDECRSHYAFNGNLFQESNGAVLSVSTNLPNTLPALFMADPLLLPSAWLLMSFWSEPQNRETSGLCMLPKEYMRRIGERGRYPVIESPGGTRKDGRVHAWSDGQYGRGSGSRVRMRTSFEKRNGWIPVAWEMFEGDSKTPRRVYRVIEWERCTGMQGDAQFPKVAEIEYQRDGKKEALETVKITSLKFLDRRAMEPFEFDPGQFEAIQDLDHGQTITPPR